MKCSTLQGQKVTAEVTSASKTNDTSPMDSRGLAGNDFGHFEKSVIHKERESSIICSVSGSEDPEGSKPMFDTSATGRSSSHVLSPEGCSSFTGIRAALFSPEHSELVGEGGGAESNDQDSSEHFRLHEEAVSSSQNGTVKASPSIGYASSSDDKQEKAEGQGSLKLGTEGSNVVLNVR